jgi:hypothetical protein
MSPFMLTITDAFTKEVGRGKTPYPFTTESIDKVYPTGDGKSTVGFKLSNGNTEDEYAFDGVHMTGMCVTAKNDPTAIKALANADAYIGTKVKAVGYTFFGPNCVLILKFCNVADATKFNQLNAVGTPEGSTSDRVWHITMGPLKRVKNTDDGWVWVKRFDDVSDEKFEFWKKIADSVPCLEGKSDEELLAIINDNK